MENHNANNTKKVEIAVSLKDLSIIWSTLEVKLISF